MVSFTKLKVKITLYSLIRCCNVLLKSFHLNGHTLGFHPQTEKLEHIVEHNKQYHMKVLLNSFHLNGHTLGFHLRTEKLEPSSRA